MQNIGKAKKWKLHFIKMTVEMENFNMKNSNPTEFYS